MLFSSFPVLPGSAKAQVTWGGIVKRLLIAYFIGNISSKKISKSVHVCQSYNKPNVGRFWDTVYISEKKQNNAELRLAPVWKRSRMSCLGSPFPRVSLRLLISSVFVRRYYIFSMKAVASGHLSVCWWLTVIWLAVGTCCIRVNTTDWTATGNTTNPLFRFSSSRDGLWRFPAPKTFVNNLPWA